jgi:hypothetical protein
VKILLHIACWCSVAAAIVSWHPVVSFQQRWVAMPAAMSWEMVDRAMKASARPSFCMPHKCRVG